jgi:hypothetical protein
MGQVRRGLHPRHDRRKVRPIRPPALCHRPGTLDDYARHAGEIDGHYQAHAIRLWKGSRAATSVSNSRETDPSWSIGTDRGLGHPWRETIALQRAIWSGKTPFEIREMKLRPDGFDLTFTEPVDPATAAKPENYTLEELHLHLPIPATAAPRSIRPLLKSSASKFPPTQKRPPRHRRPSRRTRSRTACARRTLRHWVATTARTRRITRCSTSQRSNCPRRWWPPRTKRPWKRPCPLSKFTSHEPRGIRAASPCLPPPGFRSRRHASCLWRRPHPVQLSDARQMVSRIPSASVC